MTDTDKSNDLIGVFKDIRATGTQELSKTAGAMLASTPPKDTSTTSGAVWAAISSVPTGSGNQISVAQEKREKDIIERRKA